MVHVMRSDTFTFKTEDSTQLFVHRFQPDDGVARKAVVHVAHGMAEHGARYARFAGALTKAGYVVYANDHRGHGKTVTTSDELGFFAPSNGFRLVVRDLQELVVFEKAENPGLPVFLLGHSMGGFLVQSYMIEAGAGIRGAILSSTSGKPSLLASAGRVVARVERARLGARAKSALLHKLSFEAFNKPFGPAARTAFDWLSRDPAEVDKYVADPLAGFVVSTQLWVDVLDAVAAISRPEAQARIPKGLSVFAITGSEDPVSERTKSLQQLIGAYRRAGLTDVTHKFYAGGRHEMLNETNRDEVERDMIAWLDGHVP